MIRNNINVNCDKDVIITEKFENYIYDIIDCFERKNPFNKEVFPHPIKLLIASDSDDIHYLNLNYKLEGRIEIDKTIAKPDDMSFRVRIDLFMRNNKIIQIDNLMVVV